MPDSRPSALIIGGGPTSARAALRLAKNDVEVTLLTAEDQLTPGSPAGVPPLLEATRHPRIHVLVGATVEAARMAERARRGTATGWRVTVDQAPRFVDAERCTACGACVEACPVTLPDPRGGLQPCDAVALGSGNHRAVHRSSVPTTYVIDKAGTAPCRHACPLDQRAQGYIALVRAGRFDAAYRAIKRENPFPSVCGRVCHHRCEENCTRGQVDEPVAVMALKRFLADRAAQAGTIDAAEIAPRTGCRIAVVGAGPAGLTAARELNRLGHAVTVLEALPVPGGMMRVGIPAFRLPRERLQAEIDEVLGEGVELRVNSRVENAEDLFSAGHDAVVLAVGLHVSRSLSIGGAKNPALDGQGGDLAARGVMGAIEFLRAVNLGERPGWNGHRVVVVGGGSTAMDTARICRRLGAEVEVVYRRSREEMPAHDREIAEAQREDVAIRFLANPTQVVRRDGSVVAVECVRMALGERDETGRRRPLPIQGSEFTLPTDHVLLAVGQTSDLSLLPDGDVVVQHKGVVQHDPLTLMTGRPGLFVAGDVAGTEGFVADAIASGSQVARSVDRFLRGAGGTREPVLQPVVQLTDDALKRRLANAAPRGTQRVARRSIRPETLLGDFQETEMSLGDAEAMAEAARCLSCGLCSECLACVDACPAGAINHDCLAEVFELEADVVIVDEDGAGTGIRESRIGSQGIIIAGGDRSETDAVAVDRALAVLGITPYVAAKAFAAPARQRLTRAVQRHGPGIGVFLCRCGGEIERTVDLSSVAARVEELPGVTRVGQIDFACHPEGSRVIREVISDENLDMAVLAACSCCALDQMCYSCTTQRTRCKAAWGVWDAFAGLPMQFVNVREQCAFAHQSDPTAATRKAGDLVAASIAAVRIMDGKGPRAAGFPGHTARIPITALIDEVRCRGCEDCELVCGLDAIRVTGTDGRRVAEVDALRCAGCGVCLAACSSGAIHAGDTSDVQAGAMVAAMGDLCDKTVVFSCNWGAYSAVEAAGVARLGYDPSVRLIRMMCAGRVHEGLILRAFAQGAARVLVLACGHDGDDSQCHYRTGSDRARQSVVQAQQLLSLLGMDPARLSLAEMGPGDGAHFTHAVQRLVGATSSDSSEGQV